MATHTNHHTKARNDVSDSSFSEGGSTVQDVVRLTFISGVFLSKPLTSI